jgi:AcrR family transcriptional regulator
VACLASVVAAGTPSLTGRRVPSARLAEMQHGKVLCGAVQAFDEMGYRGATVSQIIARARVSRSAFYELFADRDECLAAILAAAAGSVAGDLSAARVEALAWSERVRATLLAILEFFDREPAVARVCVVESLRAGPVALERRARILARLAVVLDEGRVEHPGATHCTPLTAEGLVGAVFAILHSRLLRERPEPLSELTHDLDAILLLPYLGEAQVPRERSRGGRSGTRTRTCRPAAAPA